MHKITRIILTILMFIIITGQIKALGCELIGKEVQLRGVQEYSAVYVGYDKKSFNMMMNSKMTGDNPGYLSVVLNNQGFEVNSYTKAKILEVNFSEQTVEVEILQGPYAGRKGWVLWEQALGY